MLRTFEQKQVVIFIVAYVFLAGFVNSWSHHHEAQAIRDLFKPRSVSTTPAKMIPRELYFSPDASGTYHWIETVSEERIVLFNLQTGWKLRWHSPNLSLLDILLVKQDGSIVPAGSGTNQTFSYIEFQVKPGVQQSVNVDFGLARD